MIGRRVRALGRPPLQGRGPGITIVSSGAARGAVLLRIGKLRMSGAPEEDLDTRRAEIARLLAAHREGDRAALDAVFPLVYGEVRRIAHRQRAANPADSLNTTAIVHEAYLKLAHAPGPGWESRAHFFAVAAKVIRWVIVDHARKHLAQKRGGRAVRLEMDEAELAVDKNAEQIVDVDVALRRLSAMSERLEQVVELRFFCGLSVEETAQTLGVTSRTVKRDWWKARAFLLKELQENET